VGRVCAAPPPKAELAREFEGGLDQCVRFSYGPQHFVWARNGWMSALCQKQTSAASFDHFVGGSKHRLRNCNVQRFSGFEVDGELDFRGLLDR
jgi:hypothetical protein